MARFKVGDKVVSGSMGSRPLEVLSVFNHKLHEYCTLVDEQGDLHNKVAHSLDVYVSPKEKFALQVYHEIHYEITSSGELDWMPAWDELSTTTQDSLITKLSKLLNYEIDEHL